MWKRRRIKKRKSVQKTDPKKMLWRQIFFGVGATIILALLMTAIWYGTRVPSLTVQKVSVTGGETISHSEIEAIVWLHLVGTHYRLVPKTFAYTYPEKAMVDEIKRQPRIKNVSIERVSGIELAVLFEEYQPFALWCEAVTSSHCLFIDREGFAFAKAPQLQGGAFLRYIDDSVVPEVGASSFDTAFVRGTNSFVEAVYQKLQLNIISVTRAQDDITYHIAGGGEVRTSTNMSFTETLSNLETILTSTEFAHLGPGNFRYIDLRYGNKVFVNEELEVEIKNATSTDEMADG